MKTISIHSKKGMQYINAYERSKATELTHVYKKVFIQQRTSIRRMQNTRSEPWGREYENHHP